MTDAVEIEAMYYGFIKRANDEGIAPEEWDKYALTALWNAAQISLRVVALEAEPALSDEQAWADYRAGDPNMGSDIGNAAKAKAAFLAGRRGCRPVVSVGESKPDFAKLARSVGATEQEGSYDPNSGTFVPAVGESTATKTEKAFDPEPWLGLDIDGLWEVRYSNENLDVVPAKARWRPRPEYEQDKSKYTSLEGGTQP